MIELEWREVKDVFQPTEKCLTAYLAENSLKTDLASFDDAVGSNIVLFVSPFAIRKLQEHLEEDTTTETGGILVGQAYWCPEKRINYTEIVGSIPALHTIRNVANFKFTAECWQSILATQKQDHPGTIIVGWYHSHPNFGVFLSATDLKTQRSCYKHNWQIAIVYDPIRDEIGFFHGAKGIPIQPCYLDIVSDEVGLNSRLKESEAIIKIIYKFISLTTNSDRLLQWRLLFYLWGLLLESKKNYDLAR